MGAKIITKEIMKNFYEKDGYLYWAVNKNYNALKDSIAGCLHKKSGYYIVSINGKRYKNHRILYQIYNNVILTENDVIDHHDRNPQNNSKENLRLDPNSENQCNKKVRKDNKSTGHKNIGIIETEWCDYYTLRITKNNKLVFCKYFNCDKFSIDDVIKIRDIKLKELHGEFASFG